MKLLNPGVPEKSQRDLKLSASVKLMVIGHIPSATQQWEDTKSLLSLTVTHISQSGIKDKFPLDRRVVHVHLTSQCYMKQWWFLFPSLLVGIFLAPDFRSPSPSPGYQNEPYHQFSCLNSYFSLEKCLFRPGPCDWTVPRYFQSYFNSWAPEPITLPPVTRTTHFSQKQNCEMNILRKCEWAKVFQRALTYPRSWVRWGTEAAPGINAVLCLHRRAQKVYQNPSQHWVDPGLKWQLIKNAFLQWELKLCIQ